MRGEGGQRAKYARNPGRLAIQSLTHTAPVWWVFRNLEMWELRCLFSYNRKAFMD